MPSTAPPPPTVSGTSCTSSCSHASCAPESPAQRAKRILRAQCMQQSLGFEVTLGSSFSGGRECCINLDMHGHASQVCQAECFSTRGLCHLPKRASVVDLRLRDCSAASVSTASFVEQSRLQLVLTIDLRADLGRLAVRRAGVGRRQQPDRVCKHQTTTSALPRPPGESTALERVAARGTHRGRCRQHRTCAGTGAAAAPRTAQPTSGGRDRSPRSTGSASRGRASTLC